MSDTDWQENCLSYIGRTQQHTDGLSADSTNCLLATLNDPTKLQAGDALPPLFHWIYFNEPTLTENLKADGHEKLGNFLPPVHYPRRMWAGSEVSFKRDLRLAQPTTRVSTIKSVTFKTSSSGGLCFVVVEHVYRQDKKDCIIDRHTIVYKEKTTPSKSAPAASGISEQYPQSLNCVILFRYSALTFNGHRIHYDEPYAQNVEGYPGLVAHGPLMATLLMRHAMSENPHKQPAVFKFRGMAPVFADDPFRIQSESAAEGLQLVLIKQGAVTAIKAEVEWL